jgi:phytol kinase
MSQVTISELPPLSGDRNSTVGSAHWQLWGIRHVADRIGVNEFRRRLLHMLPGLLPVLLWIVPHRDPWGMPLIAVVIALSLALAALAFYRESDFARPGETSWHGSVIGYIVPILAMMLLLPGRAELGLLTLGVVAFGDGSAALSGKLVGGRRLPWNTRKTWIGLSCFVIAGTLAGSLSYWSEANPGVSFMIALTIGAVAALTAGIMESLPIRSHDNFRVGATAALTGLMMHVLLLGW